VPNSGAPIDSLRAACHAALPGAKPIGEDSMSMTSHLSALEQKHEALEREIEDELSHANANTLRVSELKRQKLKLKDEINRLRKTQSGETIH
jgi:hypothetical protein